MKTPRTTGVIAFFLLVAASTAQTTLIGPGIRNGDFNDDTSTIDIRNFSQTPFWENIGGGAQSDAATRTNIPNSTGSRNAQLTQVAMIVHGQSTGHTIALGDKFTLSYSWRDGSSWNPSTDRVRVTLFTTSDDMITGTPSTLAATTSALSATLNTWQNEPPAEVYTAVASDVGKTLFVKIDTKNNNDGSGFARLDDLLLTVTAAPDPALSIDFGDYAFGDLFHLNGFSATSRTVTFRNTGATQNLTLDTISLNSDGGGIFSITSAPAPGSMIAPDATFDVEITVTGGGGYTDFAGELAIITTPSGQSTTLPITANITTSGDPFFIGTNGDFDNALSGWSGASVATSGLNSTNGARVRGVGDDRNTPATVFANNLSQAFNYQYAPDFTATVSFAIPDFNSFAPFTPDGNLLDRSFHLAILGSSALPAASTFTDADAARTIINLFYFAAGVPGDTGPGFFLYDGVGSSFIRLSSLGTLAPSTGFNLDGSPPTSLNTYQLTITGSDFGSGTAAYNIAISGANTTTVAHTASGLTTYHGLNPAATTAKAIVLTTADTVAATTDATLSNTQQPSFWVDKVAVTLSATLPVALAQLTDEADIVKMRDNETRTTSFTVKNIGIGADLTISSGVFSDPRFSLVSPSIPASIPVGSSQTFEVLVDFSSNSGTQNIQATFSTTTNDAVDPNPTIDLEGQILSDSRRILIDYDDGLANGIHEASIRNGGFEDGADGQNFIDTPVWVSRFSPEGDTTVLTTNVTPATGSLRGTASGFAGTGERAQPTQALTFAEWTLQEGDTLVFEATWKDGAGFTPGESIQFLIEVIDENGNLIFDPVSRPTNSARILEVSYPLAAPGTYQTDTATSITVRPGSPWIGGRLLARVLKNGPRTSFVDIDNISLVGTIPAPPASNLRITSIAYNSGTKDVTIRFTNTAAASYTIESDSDLDFTSGTTDYPVTGADTTTYPGEIQFLFNDPTATGTTHFWRVRSN